MTSSAPVAFDSRASSPTRLLASGTEECYDVSAGVGVVGPRTRPEAALNRVHAGGKSLQRVTGYCAGVSGDRRRNGADTRNRPADWASQREEMVNGRM
jgi:hypothetical protein